jgi:uncharacterized protein (TIGR02145 family)
MKKKNRILIYSLAIVGVFLMLANSCKKSDDTNDPTQDGTTVTDIDGNGYHTVTIGTQVWMVENLKTTKYRNGDAIPNVTDGTAWSKLTTGAYCNYNNVITNGNKYGKLYNWFAVNDSRNIAPHGWHVPSETEWEMLYEYVFANPGTSGNVAKALAAKSDWVASAEVGSIGNDLTKNNSSGFTALPGSLRGGLGPFGGGGIGGVANWWSSSQGKNSQCGLAYVMFYSYSDVNVYDDYAKSNGYSVRCIKD